VHSPGVLTSTASVSPKKRYLKTPLLPRHAGPSLVNVRCAMKDRSIFADSDLEQFFAEAEMESESRRGNAARRRVPLRRPVARRRRGIVPRPLRPRKRIFRGPFRKFPLLRISPILRALWKDLLRVGLSPLNRPTNRHVTILAVRVKPLQHRVRRLHRNHQRNQQTQDLSHQP
jgi:hypothetical protein